MIIWGVCVRSSVGAGKQRILAIASGGGHWVQLRRVAPAFSGFEVHFATVNADYARDVADKHFHLIPDATRWSKLGLIKLALRVLWLVLVIRPDFVISTGAAPGYFAIRFGKWFGARTLWLDSIANAEEMSMAGNMVRKYADVWLTQWPHLAKAEGPTFFGAVL